MSRGLGRLQRQILETLDEAKATQLPYPGSADGEPGIPNGSDLAGWIRYGGGCMRLAPGVYDLRCSSAYLKCQRVLQGRSTIAFHAAFPRAVKTLLARGALTCLELVPLAEVHRLPVLYARRRLCAQVHRLADGLYLDPNAPSQIRFVSRKPLWEESDYDDEYKW
jgi:hypothetical protein